MRQILEEAIKKIKKTIAPFTLELDNKQIGSDDVRLLAEAIKEVRAPLNLSLKNNGIGWQGVSFLAQVIKEVRVPLTLDLRSNSIGDAAAGLLAEAIKEAQAPIILDLDHNKIGDVGAQFLAEAVKEARVPLNFGLFYTISLVANSHASLRDALEDNFIIDARSNPSKFLSDIKSSPSRIMLEQALSFPTVLIKLVQDYIGEDDLARIEVAAIRAIDGASHENKYSSINYELLNAAYLAPPAVDVASVLEGAEVQDSTPPVVISVDAAQALKLEGIAYEEAGDNSNALYCQERALKMCQELYQVDRPEIAWSLNAVGILYYRLGNALRSLLYNVKALKMRKALYKAHPDIAASLSAVGISYQGLGDIRKALSYKERALNMYQMLYQGDRPEVAMYLNAVGILHEKLGDARKGLFYKKEALKMRRALYKGAHPDIADSLNSIGAAYEILGELETSLLYREQCLEMIQAIEQQNQKGEEEFKGQGTLCYADTSYPEYYSNGLDRVLELRLSGLANAVSLKSRYFEEDLGYVAWRLAYDAGAILSGGNVQIVLAPVNLCNKHWLGLLFQRSGGSIVVTYMDSEQKAMVPRLREELENGFTMNGHQSSFLEAKLTLQRYNNCGFELLENFAYYLTGTRATQEGAMYMHSLLVENSLLDPEIYGLKLEENNKLIRFLSNAEPIDIKEITLFAEQRSKNQHERTVPDNSIEQLKTNLHRASIWFKTLDFVVDSAKLVQEPSMPLLKKLALDYAQLQAMVSGANLYSVMIAGAETLYQLQLGEYQKAFNVASSTMSAMALPLILAMATRPYLGIAYGAWITASTAYGAITNAYSFAHELGSGDATLKSAMAYKDLAEWLAASPVQNLHDFEAKAKEYKLQINDLLFEKEKSIIQAQMKDDFEKKVFEYIYLPELIEKYVLLNDVIKGKLTEEEAQSLKSKPVAISYGVLEYDHCVRTEDSREEAIEYYYCCNLAGQILDHVILTSSGLEVLDNL